MTVLEAIQGVQRQYSVPLLSSTFIRLEVVNSQGREILMLEWAEEGGPLLRAKVIEISTSNPPPMEETRMKGLIRMALKELTGERTGGSWEDTVAQLRKELGSP